MISGAQCYTVRNFMQTPRDIERSLEQIARIGYTTVQISGVGPIDPRLLRDMCDRLGLHIVLTHTPEARLLDDLDAVLQEHEILGCKHIGLGSMPGRYRDGGQEWLEYFVQDFLPVAKAIAKAGKVFMYHNHNFEFARLPDGRTLMERILEAFPPELMGVTVDTYWLQAGGCDILQWLERLKGRMPCVHLKDMSVTGSEVRMAALGKGNLNFPAILQKLRELGGTEYLLVEQDDCYGESPFDCLMQSYDHLQKLGIR